MNNPSEPNAPKKKPMNYGQSQALKVVAAHRMGLNPSCVNNAIAILMGLPVHPMFAASVEREATRIHNELALDESRVREANGHVANVMAEYGFA